MVVGSFTEIVCFSSVADVLTEITNLVINYVFAVACNATLYIPGSSFCVEGLACLKVKFTNDIYHSYCKL